MKDADVPIPFKSNIKNDDDDKKSKKGPKHEFQVKLDPEGDNSRLNIQSVKINKLTSLTRNGEAFVHLLRKLKTEVWTKGANEHDNESAPSRINDIYNVLSDSGRREMIELCKDARREILSAEMEAFEENAVEDEAVFLENIDVDDPEFLLRKQYEQRIRYKINKKNWPNAQDAYQTQMEYFTTGIRKPFKTSMTEYVRRMRELALMQEYLPAPYRKGEGYNREVQDQYAALPPQSEEVIRRAIVKGLPNDFQRSVVTRCGASDYQSLTREEFEDLLEEVEKAEHKKQSEKSLARKQSDLEDANADGAPAWQKRTKKRRKKEQNTWQNEAKMCVLCKNAGRAERVYSSHNKEDCNFSKNNTKAESPDRKKYVSRKSFEKTKRSLNTVKKHLKSAVATKRSKKELRAAKKYIAECLSSSSSESSSSDGYSSNEE